ncbi:MAG: hypothetical protein LQ350_004733 [Teloschistes chrysophthalmus]|nr:MAG: hypothetical protein LQ350_004733 [Niorma chrysophthalma]
MDSTPDRRRSNLLHEAGQRGSTIVVDRRGKKKSWRFFLAFLALAVVAYASALDATSLSIALPEVVKDIGGTTLQSFWAGISFLLTSVLFQPIHTILSDIIGRKPVLYVCILFFGLGAIIFGSAKNMTVLIIGRAFQGIGGGGLEALVEIILTDITTLKERPLWLGLLGFVWAAGSVSGPIVGGAFSEYVSWRWIAWINLPLIAVSIVLIPPFLKLQTLTQPLKAKLRRLDWLGILLFLAGMTSFTLAITWGGALYAWDSWKTLLPLILGILLLVAFVAWEGYTTKEPMIPYRLFNNRTSAFSLLGAFLHGIIVFGVLFYLPIYFEGVIGDTPLRAAVEALALALPVTAFAIIAALAIDVVRRYTWSVWIGWIATTAGMALMYLLDTTSGQTVRVGYQILAGVGLGMLYPSLGIPLQAAVDLDDSGLAMGTFVFLRQTGAVVGLALGAAVFSNSFTSALPKELPPSLANLHNGNAAVTLMKGLRHLDLDAKTLRAVLDTYSKALSWVWLTMVVVGGLGLITSFAIRDITLENEDRGKQAFVDARNSDSAPLVLQPLSGIEIGTERAQSRNRHSRVVSSYAGRSVLII